MTITELCNALNALEEARRKATPGPWKNAGERHWNPKSMSTAGVDGVEISVPHTNGDWGVIFCHAPVDAEAHAAFIVAARNCLINFAKLAELVRAVDELSEAHRLITDVRQSLEKTRWLLAALLREKEEEGKG